MAEEPKPREGKTHDYEYDLAHEAMTVRPAEPPPPAPQHAPDMHATGDGGDYGHDMAHDMG